MVFNPLMVYGGLALTAVAFGAGWQVREWRCEAAQTDALKAAVKNEDEAEKIVADSAKTFEADRTTIEIAAANERVIIREIYRDIEVPADCAVDPAAAGVLDGAIERANAAASGELSTTVPAGRSAP